MSDIKIQPSATGSGTVTITAPTTNTARVITLPDGTGTLAFTTGDDDKLPLSGGTMTGNLTVGSSSGGTVLRITAANNNYAYLEMGDPDDVDIGRIVYSNINNRMQIYVNTAEKLRIHSSGIASFNDGIALGSGLDATGANVLDDYEEGTWTPVWTSAGGSITTNTTYTRGSYTKIGNLVTIFGRLYTNSVSSPTGVVTISGLPFTINALNGLNQTYQNFGLGAITGTLTGQPIIRLLSGTTTGLLFDKVWDSTEGSGDIANHFDNDCWGYFTAQYFA